MVSKPTINNSLTTVKTSLKPNSSKPAAFRYDRRRPVPFRSIPKRPIPTQPLKDQEPLKLSYGSTAGRGDHGPSRIAADHPIKTAVPSGAYRSWWVHVWSGLVRDPTGKHHKALRQAVWLYLYLLLAANWRTGTLFRKIASIATDTGFNDRTIQRWLGTLRKKGYIKTTTNGRTLNISITKWRPISRKRKPGPAR